MKMAMNSYRKYLPKENNKYFILGDKLSIQAISGRGL